MKKSRITTEGERFENLMALHLKKACDAWSDFGFGEFTLYYVRDKEKREVDFLVAERQRPYLLVECKTGEAQMSPSLTYFHERFKPKFSFQVIRRFPAGLTTNRQAQVTLCSAERFLAPLP